MMFSAPALLLLSGLLAVPALPHPHALPGGVPLQEASTAQEVEPGPLHDLGQALLIDAKRVIVRPGEELADAQVLVDGGRIVAVGTGLVAPEGARRLSGQVLMAGLIDPWSAVGLDGNSISDRTASAAARAVDALDPYAYDNLRQDALEAGVTSVRVGIGRDGRIGGLSAFVRNDPNFDLTRSVLRSDAAISTAIGAQPNSDAFTRLDEVDRLIAELEKGKRQVESQADYEKKLAEWNKAIAEKVAELEKEFKKAKRDREKEVEEAKKAKKEHKDKAYKEDKKPKAPRYDADAVELARLYTGELPLIVEIERAPEIRALLEKTKAYPRLRLVLAGATDARFFQEELAERRIPVIVLPQRRDLGGVVAHDELALAADLHEAGVTVLFGSGGRDAQATRDLPLFAALAVGRGLDREAALAALTTVPARLLDLGHRLGSVERGKDADLVLLSGDPLSTTTRVQAVLLAGELAFEAP
ncbi:MAG: amidohydrolase family protein [Planctomycetaceae bacterium]|nr:amidohydrolase family protein [Planctomycetaceae bacterium]